MLIYTATEARARFAEVLDKAAAGEEVVITRRGKPVVRLTRIEDALKNPKKSLVGLLRGSKLRIANDFDELPDDIARAFGMID